MANVVAANCQNDDFIVKIGIIVNSARKSWLSTKKNSETP